MKKLNNKGFSLVEILVAIAILAILMMVASQAFNIYKKRARQQAYDTMAKSATVATTNYLMENAKTKYIPLETLKEKQYVDTLQDPRYKEKECTGIVINKVIPGETQKQLDILFQKVKLCCKNYKYQYDFTGDDVVVTEIDSCDYVEGDEIAGVYKLIYKPQGGTPCDPGVVTKTQGEEWGPLCVTTKEKSDFKGWNTKKNGSGTTITEHTIVEDKDINVYAIWNPIYSLTYSEEGGTVCDPKTIEKENGEKWGTLCSTSKPGHAFKGWNTKKDGTGSTITKNTYAEKNLTVYAKWNPYYTITFDSNGGTACNPATITKEKGEKWGTLCSPSRTGYTFKGWNTKQDGTGTTIRDSSEAAGNIKVYAKWEQKSYVLTYYNNGGSGCTTKNGTYGSTWGTLCIPKREHYTFTKWTVKPTTEVNSIAPGGTEVKSSDVITKSVDAIANWTKVNYTLTFDTTNASCSPSKITKPYNEAWGTLCSPTKTGYTFGGWKNGSTTITSTSKATANITVTPVWNAKTYTLKYNDNNGSGCSSKTITKSYNTEWGTLCTPTRTGYTFAGWKNGSTTVTSTSKATANITVTAQWNANTYTLKYNDNGGSGCSSKSITKSYNTAWGTLCTPTKTGHTFAGWKNGSTTVTATSKATASITVTAQWNTNTYTLRYNDNGGSGCSSKSITRSYNTAWGTLCTPTRSGYSFSGWKNGSTKVTATSNATANITVTAQWTALTQRTFRATVELKDYYSNTVNGYNQSISCSTYDSSCTASTTRDYVETRSGTLVTINPQSFTLNTTGSSLTHSWDFTDSYYVTDSNNGLNARKRPSASAPLVDGLNIGHSFIPSRIAYDSSSACANHVWAYGRSVEEGWYGWVCSYYLY